MTPDPEMDMSMTLAAMDLLDMRQAYELIGDWLSGKPVDYDHMAYIGMLFLSIAHRNGVELPGYGE